MKYKKLAWDLDHPGVAPYTGAWIEIDTQKKTAGNITVAPYTGAWIEIYA
ncbi:hypothetical protein [Caproicibacterium sp. XB2]